MLAGYGSDFFDDFQADLQNPSWPAFNNGASPASRASVVTSLDLEPANVLFAVAWIQSAQQTGFEPVQNTVTAANLRAAAAQEGASSRVITAISNNAGQITYFSYGWQADTATLYETQVVTTSPTDAPTAAANLAAQGFIITATGLCQCRRHRGFLQSDQPLHLSWRAVSANPTPPVLTSRHWRLRERREQRPIRSS
jgi:hypothetical protein